MENEIELHTVSSSQIMAIGHDGKRKLAVRFQNGALWFYSPVSPTLYEEMNNASSVGQFFNQNIKKNPEINGHKG